MPKLIHTIHELDELCLCKCVFLVCTFMNAPMQKKKKNVNEASTEINELFGIYVIFTPEEQH